MNAAQRPTTPAVSDQRRPNRRRIWLVGATVVWAILLGWLTYTSIGQDEPTVREQRSIGEAMPVVHRALGDVVAAAGSDVVVEVSPATVRKGCRVTPFRDGASLEQAVILRTAEADGPALLDRIAQRLPASYQAGTRHGRAGGDYLLRADAGEFVTVKGTTNAGLVTLTASTGCRPVDDMAFGDLLPLRGIDEEPARVLTALGASIVQPGRSASAACPGDGAVYTARAVGRGAQPQAYGKALRPLHGSDAVVVVDQPDVYAYRDGRLSVVVETVDGEIRVAVTSTCP